MSILPRSRSILRAAAVGVALLAAGCVSAPEPVFFGDATGQTVALYEIVIVDGEQTIAAPFPDFSTPQGEERVDLSGLPLLDQVVKPRFAPGDVELAGEAVGRLHLDGDRVVVVLDRPDLTPEARGLILASDTDGFGAISYHFAPPPYTAAEAPRIVGPRVGTAYLLGDRLALVEDGARPLIRDLWRFARGEGG